jgi:hypothetical protein
VADAGRVATRAFPRRVGPMALLGVFALLCVSSTFTQSATWDESH